MRDYGPMWNMGPFYIVSCEIELIGVKFSYDFCKTLMSTQRVCLVSPNYFSHCHIKCLNDNYEH
jgi:hypothetical protein